MQPDSGDPTTIAAAASAAAPRVGMAEFTAWLDVRVESLGDLWVQEIGARGLGQGRIDGAILERFTRQLVSMLPLMLGPHRDQIHPLWVRGFELFGAVAAKRGLAAGEAIEEVHLLREFVIRDLYRDPPMGGAVPLSLREVLRLNRALDGAVTHASVGHTDALFFEFFEAEGAALLPGNDIAAEVSEQLGAIGHEVHLIEQASNGGGAR
ncbi:MAG: hypothetical protein OXU33_06485 [Gemmatimonadota bacterium]|nr:hypothetical protein [Gemmatimonadota bacterium]MDE3006313.1 hypothetical protein [Gemmatimonadota bacterium]MDE3013703.1 hypothetical protein [Gemmatimonadota bacterium]